MINDRDLFILGAGALLAVLCLLLPFPFWGKATAGFIILVGGMVLALLRLGPDRIPFETWLWRWMRYALGVRRYTYQQPGWRLPRSRWKWLYGLRSRASSPGGERTTMEAMPSTSDPVQKEPRHPGLQPLSMVPVGAAAYPLATVCLAALSSYFVAWLAQGGGASLARWFP
jgi:hypothetical protein